MSQVCPRVALANAAAAVRVEGLLVLRVARLLDRNSALRGEQQAMPRRSSRQHAIHHVNAEMSVLDNLFRGSDSHQVTGLVGGKMLERRFDDLACHASGLTHAQPADGVARKSDLDGALSRFSAQLGIHGPLDNPEKRLR